MNRLYLPIIKRAFSTHAPKKKVCVVGAGPAGFYAAQHLTKCTTPLEIDIYERLPVPFGLVRFGVAPDHPEVKNVINTFSKTAENPNVRFVGNVSLGSDVSLDQLEEAYNCVLLAYGAEENRKLDIPGENLPNVIPARRIVGWYNGIFADATLPIDLSCTNVAIIGQGNVAIDVARMLLSPVDLLKFTDITQHALDALSESKVKEVHLIGRRGPLQAAFTIKELREMLKLKNCSTVWCDRDFDGISELVPNLARPRKRITELMLKSLTDDIKHEKVFRPVFFKSPIEIAGGSRVERIKLGINELCGDQLPILTNRNETLNCDLVVTSIGYKSIQVDPSVPFDLKRGKAISNGGKIRNGLYATGWLATGPTGVILTTMNNAFGTAEMICRDLESGDHSVKEGFEAVSKHLNKENKRYVTWNGWKKIDAFEQEQGRKVGKPREKVLSLEKMLEIAL
ncbi:hypothetical protein PPYR_04611 [Photinus pyralis]|uniref:NADPH:adrenodoxin oxidoreductase, mitochondrial n=1 Tax=Photinus pyralis TaxID=7054 RepID=A0A5N4AYJ6_PHOPY|nr:NADPH:adrenodoxin oxidoreductase, mitochondrial [Photinus pyralis]KAB0802425.1 hypothetical protein PPYR_04611 [Photinus pyralis]